MILRWGTRLTAVVNLLAGDPDRVRVVHEDAERREVGRLAGGDGLAVNAGSGWRTCEGLRRGV